MATKKRKLEDGRGENDHQQESNPLLQLTSYDDEDEEETEMEIQRGTVDNGHGGERNGWRKEDGEDDEELSEEEVSESDPSAARSRRQVELRRDCPYLDTVNRQVISVVSTV